MTREGENHSCCCHDRGRPPVRCALLKWNVAWILGTSRTRAARRFPLLRFCTDHQRASKRRAIPQHRNVTQSGRPIVLVSALFCNSRLHVKPPGNGDASCVEQPAREHATAYSAVPRNITKVLPNRVPANMSLNWAAEWNRKSLLCSTPAFAKPRTVC